MKIIVVGAGLAGLTATHELRKRGIDVVTLEQSNTPGGRVVRSKEDGYIIDIAAQFLAKNYFEAIDLCREIGLGDDLIKVPIKSLLWNNGKSYEMAINWNPVSLTKDLRFFLSALGVKSMPGLLRFMAYVLTKWRKLGSMDMSGQMELDDENFAELALRLSNSKVLENYLQPVVSGIILNDPEDLGAILGLNIFWIALSSMLSGLVLLKEGIGSITDRLVEMYKDCIRLSTPVREIVIEDGAVKGVKTADGFMDADAVICATTATTAIKLMPELPDPLRGALGKATYCSCCHVVLGVENQPFPEGTFGIFLPRNSGSILASIGSGRNFSPDLSPDGDLLHCFIADKKALELFNLSDSEIIEMVIDEANKYLPEPIGNIRLSKVYRFDEGLFNCPPGTTGILMKMSKESSSVVKGLYLAGEYLRVGGVGTTVTTARDAVNLLQRESTGAVDKPRAMAYG